MRSVCVVRSVCGVNTIDTTYHREHCVAGIAPLEEEKDNESVVLSVHMKIMLFWWPKTKALQEQGMQKA